MPVSLRRDLFLVGVPVTACSRELSAVRGRIGEGGRSRRGGFGSEGGCLFTIGNTRPRCEVENGRDTEAGTENCFPSRRCQRRAERCGEGRGRAGSGRGRVMLVVSSSPFGDSRPRRRLYSLLPCVQVRLWFVSNAFQFSALAQCPIEFSRLG